jgi:hypothetical protein
MGMNCSSLLVKSVALPKFSFRNTFRKLLSSFHQMIASIPTLLPAYGRDYKNKAAILADLNGNKDFCNQWHQLRTDKPGATVNGAYQALL